MKRKGGDQNERHYFAADGGAEGESGGPGGAFADCEPDREENEEDEEGIGVAVKAGDHERDRCERVENDGERNGAFAETIAEDQADQPQTAGVGEGGGEPEPELKRQRGDGREPVKGVQQVECGWRVIQVRQERVSGGAEAAGPVGEDFVAIEIVRAVGGEGDEKPDDEGDGAGGDDRSAGEFQVTRLAEEFSVFSYQLSVSEFGWRLLPPAAFSIEAPATRPPAVQDQATRGCGMACQAIGPMLFAERLANPGPINAPVEDATGLEGGWDFTFSFNPAAQMMAQFAERAGRSDRGGGSERRTDDLQCYRKQLGLKLEAEKKPVPVIVIDKLNQKPTDSRADEGAADQEHKRQTEPEQNDSLRLGSLLSVV